MGRRTFVVGDIHGDLDALRKLVGKMPTLEPTDTLVFLGDYVDRGPHSAEVVEVVRGFQRDAGFEVVCLRGNHEDAWLRVLDRRWDEFVFPPGNGCLATMRSYTGGPHPEPGTLFTPEEQEGLFSGAFFPRGRGRVVREPAAVPRGRARDLRARGPRGDQGRFLHPSEIVPPHAMLWTRTKSFFTDYRGKRVVVGHTVTDCLPADLSTHTPADPTDFWAGECVVAIDTGAGKDGFLTAIELPALRVWESR
ncbi:MAG: serine/threonine protein phosphatase [Myxococcales bacterium]|nr:serine/threonine protein phosphatase [Myxococcales bacterium]